MIELTADDIKAMRAADRYASFRRDEHGNASIQLTRRVQSADGWTADGSDEQVREIALGDQCSVYRGESVGKGDVESCYWPVSSPNYDGAWVTFVRSLKAGDRLTLVWSVNYDITGTNHLIAAGLVGESFEVRVYRPAPTRKRDVTMTFRFGTQVMPAADPHRFRNVRFKAEPTYTLAASA